ncbi:MAG TPA: response regulator transcription factor [Thermoanaerobaculia bacterium]|nr:response regulator transcription factor [Thermoanaerobaculia bacterium]HQN07374.1 response regulator transcription factor [Thermoanaerobaculia bacterium]HQP85417.1 response regulator transcription factor [Thermoanaerobaculia bacterium]
MRILVVEDDPKLLESVRKGLKEAGFGADGASDGREGLQRALEDDYDALVLDVMLPGLSGLDVLRELRKRRRATPVLVLSARSAVEDRVRGLDLGADDYLAKPFSFAELLARLRAITRRPAVEPQTVLSAGDLTVDSVRHEARRGGQLLELTPKEFSLLEYLARRKGVVLTRAMILDHVWDLDYDGGSNLVEVYVNYLRKKVDAGHEVKLIHTVRGAGYVLREPS